VSLTHRRLALAACLGLIAPCAQATPALLAIGTLNGSADLSGLSGNLENGLPASILGGTGSGITWAGGNRFLAVPDRGPNATPYNTAVDDTVSYTSRFHSISMSLTPNGGPGLPFNLTPTLLGTTLLWNAGALAYGSGAAVGLRSGAPAQNTAGRFYFSGRSDNFDAAQNSGNPANGRFDPESIRVSNNGTRVFVSDEYGPYVYQFNTATGERVRSYTLPGNLYVATPNPKGSVETASNTSGRTDNKGMEGLAITPDGKTLVGIMQASLIQDSSAAGGKLLRIVSIDVASGATHEYAYKLTAGSGVSDIVALNHHEFLVDERDGKGLGDGSNASVKQVFKIDLAGATDVTGMDGATAATHAVGKSLFLDIVGVLNGVNGIPRSQIPAKLEGLTFGEDVDVGGTLTHTLWVSNDNDFLPAVAGPNQFYVFGFTDADLAGSLFAPQLVPEPASSGLLAVGLLGLLGVARRRTA